MWVIVRTGHVAQVALRHQAAVNRGTGTHQFFGRIAFEVKRVLVYVQLDAVYLHLLADIPGDQVGIKTAFFEVIILRFRTAVRQVQGFGNGRLYLFIVGTEVKKVLVEYFDVIPRLYRRVRFGIGGKSFQRLAVCQDINMVFKVGRGLVAFVNRITGDDDTGDDQQIAEAFDMLKSGIDIFELTKHLSCLLSVYRAGNCCLCL